MSTDWSRREKNASFVIGVISMVFLIAGAMEFGSLHTVPAIFDFGCAFAGFSLAVAPDRLFEKVKIGRDARLFGITAILTMAATACFIVALVLWLIGKMQ